MKTINKQLPLEYLSSVVASGESIDPSMDIYNEGWLCCLLCYVPINRWIGRSIADFSMFCVLLLCRDLWS